MEYVVLLIMVILLVFLLFLNEKRKEEKKKYKKIVSCLENMIRIGEFEGDYLNLLEQMESNPKKSIKELVEVSTLPENEKVIFLNYLKCKVGIMDKKEQRRLFCMQILSTILGIVIFFVISPLLYVLLFINGLVKEPYESLAHCLLISMLLYFFILFLIERGLSQKKIGKELKATKQGNLINRFESFMDTLIGR